MNHEADRSGPMTPVGEDVGGRLGPRLRRLRPLLLPITLLCVLLGLWEWAVPYFGVLPGILPPPSDIMRKLVILMPIIMSHTWPTASETGLGFLIALVLGFSIACMMTFSQIFRETFYPGMVVFQIIPKVALAPLFIVWFGIGSEMRLAFATFISFFPIMIATATGLTNVPTDMTRLGRSLTATRWQIFRTIQLPVSLPHLFSGMKIAMTMAIIGVIVGEFIASQRGLGYLILLSASQAEMAMVFAAILVLCIVGLALYGAVVLAELIAKRYYRFS